jgi:hypothetical protein
MRAGGAGGGGGVGCDQLQRSLVSKMVLFGSGVSVKLRQIDLSYATASNSELYTNSTPNLHLLPNLKYSMPHRPWTR